MSTRTFNRIMMSMWTWFAILVATGLYVVYVYMVGEAKPAHAERESKPVVVQRESDKPDVIAQQRGVDAREPIPAESDVNVPADPSAPTEDEQGWDCYSMGNGICGANPEPKYSYEDGSQTYAQPDEGVKATVTGSDVNQRGYPGMHGEVTGNLDKGFTFEAVCRVDGFYQGSNGNYVSDDYVQIAGSVPDCAGG